MADYYTLLRAHVIFKFLYIKQLPVSIRLQNIYWFIAHPAIISYLICFFYHSAPETNLTIIENGRLTNRHSVLTFVK